ncbi:MAG: hypothetical protein ACR2F4_08675 [Thermoleophilaceae bacterium]
MTALRDLRAYLAGLGTTAILAVGAAILLVTATSLVAFSSWSSLERADGVGDLVLKDAPASQPQAGPRPRAEAARTADAAGAPAPASGATAGDRVSGGREPLRPAPSTAPRLDEGQPPPVDAFRPVSPPPVTPTAAPLPPTPRPPTRAPLLRGATDDLGKTTEDLTADLGGVLELVDPQLGETVDDTGKVLGDVVRNLGSSY